MFIYVFLTEKKKQKTKYGIYMFIYVFLSELDIEEVWPTEDQQENILMGTWVFQSRPTTRKHTYGGER